jgi:hypothetical protein
MSTLHVENLKGLSSGSNANKIIVPSGQELHAAGHVVQIQNTSLNGGSSNTTSTSFVDAGLSLNITPKFATSKILVIVHQVAAILGGSGNTRIDFRCIEANSSTELYRMDYHGQDGVISNTQRNMSGSGVFQCSSTNQLTFKTQVQKAQGQSNESGSIYYDWYGESVLTMTALEIAQ